MAAWRSGLLKPVGLNTPDIQHFDTVGHDIEWMLHPSQILVADQVEPAFVVYSTRPLPAAIAQQLSIVRHVTAESGPESLVGIDCSFQVVPPSVVSKILPALLATQHVEASTHESPTGKS